MTGATDRAVTTLEDRWAAFAADRPQWQADLALVAGVLAATYLVFVAFGLLLGLDVNGIVNTLQRVTFYAAVYSLVVLALNLHWGYTGLFNIGVAGFMSVAVFTMAIVAGPEGTGFGLPVWVGMIAGLLAAALVGFVAALPALRLRADYFAIVTLGISEIIRLSFKSAYLREFELFGYTTGTGGGSSITVTGPRDYVLYLLYQEGSRREPPTLLGDALFALGDAVGVQRTVLVSWTYAAVLVAVVLLLYLLLSRIAYSPFGRLLKAIREDELAAQSLGKDTDRVKIYSFMLGCALMGLAGMLWYGSRPAVSPDTFVPILTFYAFVALIIGGAGSNTGSVVGAILFAGALWQAPRFVRRIIRDQLDVPRTQTFYDAVAGFGELDPLPMLGYVEANIDQLRFVLLGAVLIALMLWRPDGALGHRKELATAATDVSRPGGDTDDGRQRR